MTKNKVNLDKGGENLKHHDDGNYFSLSKRCSVILRKVEDEG